jgi:methylmalonyl-CoA mutase
VKKQNKSYLFSEFEPVDRVKWETQIKKDLNGGDYTEQLAWETLEGIRPLPFYRRDDLEKLTHIPVKSTTAESRIWSRTEPILEPDPSAANRQIKEAIAGGANAIQFKSHIHYGDGETEGNLSGVQIHSQTDFDALFHQADLDELKVVADSDMYTPVLLAMVQHHTPTCDALFTYDPFTYTARHGRTPDSDERLNDTIRELASHVPQRTLVADGLFYHSAGATIVQELGISLAIASEYLARIDAKNADQAVKSIWFRLSAGPLYFPEIAKFRALRLLWKNLLNAYGLGDSKAFIHAETTLQNKSSADAHNNMLRSTTEAMAAVTGGADSLTIHPYDAAYNQPESFSRRISRNIHHILADESHLDKVNNPADGSYYIESLTSEITEKAWQFFTRIEKQGGFLKAFESRMIQTEIRRSQQAKLEAYSNRKRVLVGVNQYPAEEIAEADSPLPVTYTSSLIKSNQTVQSGDNLINAIGEALDKGASSADFVPLLLNPKRTLYPALAPFRAPEAFEQLRKQTQRFEKNRGRKPLVRLVPAGNAKWRKLRTTFAQNLLGCAGFRIETLPAATSVNELDHESNGADIYVLCGADHDYIDYVDGFCKKIGDGAIRLLAGNGGDHRQQFQDMGIDHFIYSGINATDLLTDIQNQLFNKKDLS